MSQLENPQLIERINVRLKGSKSTDPAKRIFDQAIKLADKVEDPALQARIRELRDSANTTEVTVAPERRYRNVTVEVRSEGSETKKSDQVGLVSRRFVGGRGLLYGASAAAAGVLALVSSQLHTQTGSARPDSMLASCGSFSWDILANQANYPQVGTPGQEVVVKETIKRGQVTREMGGTSEVNANPKDSYSQPNKVIATVFDPAGRNGDALDGNNFVDMRSVSGFNSKQIGSVENPNERMSDLALKRVKLDSVESALVGNQAVELTFKYEFFDKVQDKWVEQKEVITNLAVVRDQLRAEVDQTCAKTPTVTATSTATASPQPSATERPGSSLPAIPLPTGKVRATNIVTESKVLDNPNVTNGNDATFHMDVPFGQFKVVAGGREKFASEDIKVGPDTIVLTVLDGGRTGTEVAGYDMTVGDGFAVELTLKKSDANARLVSPSNQSQAALTEFWGAMLNELKQQVSRGVNKAIIDVYQGPDGPNNLYRLNISDLASFIRNIEDTSPTPTATVGRPEGTPTALPVPGIPTPENGTVCGPLKLEQPVTLDPNGPEGQVQTFKNRIASKGFFKGYSTGNFGWADVPFSFKVSNPNQRVYVIDDSDVDGASYDINAIGRSTAEFNVRKNDRNRAMTPAEMFSFYSTLAVEDQKQGIDEVLLVYRNGAKGQLFASMVKTADLVKMQKGACPELTTLFIPLAAKGFEVPNQFASPIALGDPSRKVQADKVDTFLGDVPEGTKGQLTELALKPQEGQVLAVNGGGDELIINGTRVAIGKDKQFVLVTDTELKLNLFAKSNGVFVEKGKLTSLEDKYAALAPFAKQSQADTLVLVVVTKGSDGKLMVESREMSRVDLLKFVDLSAPSPEPAPVTPEVNLPVELRAPEGVCGDLNEDSAGMLGLEKAVTRTTIDVNRRGFENLFTGYWQPVVKQVLSEWFVKFRTPDKMASVLLDGGATGAQFQIDTLPGFSSEVRGSTPNADRDLTPNEVRKAWVRMLGIIRKFQPNVKEVALGYQSQTRIEALDVTSIDRFISDETARLAKACQN